MSVLIKKCFKSAYLYIAIILFVILSLIALCMNNRLFDNLKQVILLDNNAFNFSVMTNNVFLITLVPIIAIVGAYSIIFQNNKSVNEKSIWKYSVASGIVGGLTIECK